MDTKTKVCKKCGWVLAIQDPTTKCPICKTWFEYGLCRFCKQPVVYYRHGRAECKDCYNKHVRDPEAMTRVRQRYRAFCEEWLLKVSKVPKDYHTLTETEWLEAVCFFNGCAMCGADDVDTRKYLVPFELGGRYCDWNIVPVCEECAKHTSQEFNLFLYRPAGINKIRQYLEVKLNEAIRQSDGTDSNSTESGSTGT